MFALPLLVFKLTGSALSLALATVATFLPYLLFGLVIGAAVGRVDRKRLMILKSVSTSASVSAAVGSSSTRMRASCESALAISTNCCWPMPRCPTGVRGSSGRFSSSSSFCARL